MKRTLILIIALSLLLSSTASAFQGGGGESTKKKAVTKKKVGTQSDNTTPTAGSIRHVDFRNFTYPLDGYLARNYRTNRVRVRKGRFIFSRDSDYGPDGFEVTRTIYGDLTGDGQEEAAVLTAVGFIESGTSQQAPGTYAYIYSMANGRPVLLKIYDSESDDSDANIAYRNYFRDRTTLLYGGVTKIEGGLLVVESLAGAGRCCPEYEVTMRFRWDGQRFILAGQPQRRRMKLG